MVLISGGITQPLVKTYNSAGSQLGYFLWDKGRIEAMGWTNAEILMIVEQTGEVVESKLACHYAAHLQHVLPCCTCSDA